MIMLYVAGRVLRDFGELIDSFLLPKTPTGFSMFVFLLLVGYACFAGIERMARLGEMFIPLVLLLLVLQVIFLSYRM
ncbi:spore germination protein [Brevibacillus humidisoli]|nr:GerAB/ArcD/ProY family transporter [Brevibacillus humidisoli]UFJ39144.1 spore germination protein [Brevibacillus humidisoli]